MHIAIRNCNTQQRSCQVFGTDFFKFGTGKIYGPFLILKWSPATEGVAGTLYGLDLDRLGVGAARPIGSLAHGPRLRGRPVAGIRLNGGAVCGSGGSDVETQPGIAGLVRITYERASKNSRK